MAWNDWVPLELFHPTYRGVFHQTSNWFFGPWTSAKVISQAFCCWWFSSLAFWWAWPMQRLSCQNGVRGSRRFCCKIWKTYPTRHAAPSCSKIQKRMNRIDQPTLEPFPNIRTNPQFFRGRAEPKGCPKQGLDSTCSTLHLLIVPLPHGQVVVSLAAGKNAGVFWKGDWERLLMEEILHQLIGSSSHYLQWFIYPTWCRISSINSMMNDDFFAKGNSSKILMFLACLGSGINSQTFHPSKSFNMEPKNGTLEIPCGNYHFEGRKLGFFVKLLVVCSFFWWLILLPWKTGR